MVSVYLEQKPDQNISMSTMEGAHALRILSIDANVVFVFTMPITHLVHRKTQI